MRDWPGPGEKTIHGIGDVHWGSVRQERLDAIATDLANGYEDTPPAARVQVGDLSQAAQQAQLANGVDWLDSLPASTGDLPLDRAWVAIPGNHDRIDNEFDVDVEDADTYDYNGTGSWETETGLTDHYAVDLDWVRLLMVGWTAGGARLTQTQLDFIASEATAAGSQECWLVIHPPIYNTVTGPLTGRRRVYSSSGIDGFHVLGVSPDTQSTAIKALIAAHPNIRVVLSGHTHSPIDAPGCVTSLTLGGQPVAHINCSALQWTFPAENRRREPIRTPYITRTRDGVEVRWRDHRNRSWVGPRPGVRLESVAL